MQTWHLPAATGTPNSPTPSALWGRRFCRSKQHLQVKNDATAGNTDVLSFATGIANNQLWFSHTGNDLAISIIGTADKMTVQNWYLGDQYHVEQIKTSDNKVLLDTQVEALVQAMASFTPPSMGQSALSASQQTALAPVLAANWH